MNILDFTQYSLWVVIGFFLAAAALVWFAGTRLSRYADAIAEKTGIGRAFIGALLLGGVTSLPEVMTTVTASAIGNAELAVNNIFGGVAMQVAILAFADVAAKDKALSSITADPTILLQGALLVLLLAVAASGIVVGEPVGWPIGVWSTSLILLAALGFFLVHSYGESQRWEPIMLEDQERRGAEVDPEEIPSVHERRETMSPAEEVRAYEADGEEGGRSDARATDEERQARNKAKRQSLGKLVLLTSLAALAILVAGFVLAKTGDAIAHKTPLGSSFVGVAFVAVSTSLPEVSTTLAAARIGRYDMAFSNVYGANLLDVGILALADAVYIEGPVLNAVGDFSLFGAMLGIVVTSIYLIGLVERRNRTFGRMGLDSITVLAVYLAGLFGLWLLR